MYRAISLALNASPVRNTCILGGDFNTEAQGSALQQGVEDGDEGLQEVLQAHGMCPLNTWHGKPKATNVTSGAYSQMTSLP